MSQHNPPPRHLRLSVWCLYEIEHTLRTAEQAASNADARAGIDGSGGEIGDIFGDGSGGAPQARQGATVLLPCFSSVQRTRLRGGEAVGESPMVVAILRWFTSCGRLVSRGTGARVLAEAVARVDLTHASASVVSDRTMILDLMAGREPDLGGLTYTNVQIKSALAVRVQGNLPV